MAVTIDQGLKAKARELLAADEETDGHHDYAAWLRQGCPPGTKWGIPYDRLRLIATAIEAGRAEERAEALETASTPSPSLPSREAIANIAAEKVALEKGQCGSFLAYQIADAILSLLPVNGSPEAIAKLLGGYRHIGDFVEVLRALSKQAADNNAATWSEEIARAADLLSLPVNGWREGVEAAALDALNDVKVLVGELIDKPSSREFFGIGSVLTGKLRSIKVTAESGIRALSAAPGEGAGG